MTENNITLKDILKSGFIAGLITLSLAVIGFIALLDKRELVAGILSLGHVFLFTPIVLFAYIFAERVKNENKLKILGSGLLIGIITSIPLLILILIENFLNIRAYLVNVSPDLIELLMFNQDIIAGSLILMIGMGLVGLLAAGLRTLPDNIRPPIIAALGWTLLIGTFSEILSGRLRSFFGPQFVKIIFIRKALHPLVAGILLLIFAGLEIVKQRREKQEDVIRPLEKLDPRIKKGLGMILLLFLPLILGTYLTEVVNNVGLYVLMGIGLNIVVGYAGLLDLGYVAFFAIGAYVMGILTTEGHLGFVSMSFWTALPFSVGAATLAGILLGMPVLRMRGDYLAIVTLGFGEIIRILALSDMLKNSIGGAQGVLQIPKPNIAGFDLVKPEFLFYVILIGVLIALFVSWRLQDSRLGRQWMAMREDEDVAEAMGINLVSTKLLAFATGAAFSGLAGAIFASKLTSIFPHSFNLIVSINVLCLIIVGGIGSLPGVIVGAFILVGLPELLREFAEYRMLMYGALLIIMMLAIPEGFLPSEVTKREMHAHEIKEPSIPE